MTHAQPTAEEAVIVGLWGIVRRCTVFTLLISHQLLRKSFEATGAKNIYETETKNSSSAVPKLLVKKSNSKCRISN